MGFQMSFSFFAVATRLSILHGVGTLPAELNDPTMLSLALKHWFLSQLFYIMASTFLRVSAALSLLPYTLATDGVKRFHASVPVPRVCVLAVIGVSLLWGIMLFLVSVGQCDPIHYFWTEWLGTEGLCVDGRVLAEYAYWFSAVGATTGIALSMMPIWLVLREDISKNSKRGVVGLVVAGCL